MAGNDLVTEQQIEALTSAIAAQTFKFYTGNDAYVHPAWTPKVGDYFLYNDGGAYPGWLYRWNGADWDYAANLRSTAAAEQHVTLDVSFGTTPRRSVRASVAVPTATVGQFIAATPSAVGLPRDEWELEPHVAAAVCLVDGTVTVYVHSLSGPISGTRRVLLSL